jgi:GntR family transcriptional regulator
MGDVAVTSRLRGAAVHKHVQVREYVRALMADAEAGSPAPSERELVQRFGVARMTVRQALDTLVAEGLLERVPGRGTFVAESRVDHVPRLTGFTEEMTRRGMRPGARTLVARIESAGPGVARALEIAVGQSVVHWQRLRLADDSPMCVEDAYLDAGLVPGMLDHLPSSLYAELERRGLTPSWGEDSVEASLAQENEARLLGVPVGHPALRVARRAFCDRTPVEVSRSTYRADRFTMWVPLTRVPQPRR